MVENIPNCRGIEVVKDTSEIQVMNSGLGNRDSFRSPDVMSQDDGRITYYPLCLQGRNDEIHLIMHCSARKQGTLS